MDLEPIDGFAFLHWLKSNNRVSGVPYIFVSDQSGADEVNRGFELGALDYIVKPFNPEVLTAKVKRTLGLS